MEMRRGELVTVALQRDPGKPRPALVIRSDLFDETHPTVTLLPVTGEIRSAPLFRVTVVPSEANGLKKVSQVMVDKPVSVKRDRIGKPLGNIEDEALLRVNRALAVWVGLA
jgi:mRNA interferase MazF